MKKVLFVANLVKMHLMEFHIPYLKWLKNKGYEIHVCAKNDYENKEDCSIPYCHKYFDISFERTPFNLDNIAAYKKLKRIIDFGEYDIIHCHTPVAAALTRMAAKKARKKGTKVIYTAHGFHFFKGAPLKNWILFYPVELWLARYTDVLITINKEDYDIAQKFKSVKVVYVPGVGVDTEKFKDKIVDKWAKRNELGVPMDAFVVLSIGELNKNKNHETSINAIAQLNNPNVYYLICGEGALENYLKHLIYKLGLEKKVKLLGYRMDIVEIIRIADVFVFPSSREGLSVALMEAMSTGLPVVCSKIRGNNDLIKDGKGGYLVESNDVNGFVKGIENLINDTEIRKKMGDYNIQEVKKYDKDKVKAIMAEIYEDVINGVVK
ncbi:glycosyltransferase family 4 protein [Haloimpatiens lingqiaonensis]|uniref:glycosyltransferase family 4 protein n=1 Tax=Haloimpatiens lingqiaonensis TaxID=1380675 RepID=UPI0010FE8D20|nr:glycosyltransferase family 4 protein [Haloimpatiens lingqiaonensis]